MIFWERRIYTVQVTMALALSTVIFFLLVGLEIKRR
jgi:hypothetical protein